MTEDNKVTYRVILLRHSKAEPATMLDDMARELVPQGRRKAAKSAQKILKKDYNIAEIVSSTASRAYQTAEIVANELNASDKLTTNDDLYYARNDDYLKIIHEAKVSADINNPTLIIVGHEPIISEVALHMLDSNTEHQLTHEAINELRFGLSTANYVTLKSTQPFAQWDFHTIRKAKISHIE